MEPIVRMALTGRHERITAERARQLGILSEVVDPPERLREAARELADQDRPQLTRRHGRHQAGALGRARARASPTPAGPGARELVGMWGHPDQEEGPRSFTDKREPQWQEI